MAKPKYDGPLDKHTDFTHAGPNGEPASGKAVQRYIKQIDSRKVGIGYTLPDGSAHHLFADEEDKNAWLADPSQTGLIIDTIPMKALYKIVYDLITPQFNPVFIGSTGNYIEYTFDTQNDSGQSVGENVVAEYTITHGTTVRTVTQTYRAGETARFNMDSYLLSGTVSVAVKLTGVQTGLSTIFGLSYQVINLILTDIINGQKGTNVAAVYTVESGSTGNVARVDYYIEGSGSKLVEWYLDGVRVPLVAEEDIITSLSATPTKYINIDNLSQGVHSIQFRAGVQVSGEMYYSYILYREFFVSRGDHTEAPYISVAVDIPSSEGILPASGTVTINAKQYEAHTLRFGVWNPDLTDKNVAVLSADGKQIASIECTEGQEAEASIIFNSSGNKTVEIVVGENLSSRELAFSVEATDMNIHEITSSLEFNFEAGGRTNESSNKDTWTDGTHTATFSEFAWNENSGWVDGKLLVPSGASVSFNYAPLSGEPTMMGKTIELDFSSIRVDDEDAPLISLLDSNNVGIKLTGTEILVRSLGGAQLSRRYKSDEHMRLSIVINRAAGSTNKCLLFVYFNGILSMATFFAASDSFSSSVNLSIGGTDTGILLRQVRIYNTALSSDAVLNNYILYQDTATSKVSIYEMNDIYETGTNKFDVYKIAAYLPVMVITGNIPAIENTIDKKLQIFADVRYINQQDPSRSFMMKDAIITGQGTSSMRYPKKNLRLYTRESDQTIVYDANGNVVSDKLYSFKDKAQRVDCWCLKTDFAESSGTHNTGVARLMNEILKDTMVGGEYVLRTEAQILAEENDYQYDIRTTVDGFPIVVFYHLNENDDLIFLGKYNFNNDKSTESVFGFTQFIPEFDNSNVECWECLDSANDLALFKTVEGFDSGWKNAWEARYPDKNKDVTALKALATWVSSTADADPSAAAGSAARAAFDKWQSEKDDHFDLNKLAAYYVYLMRFGAVDQTVKNSMLTTEDGEHWYFILYDNDTINGVRNDGALRYGPDIDRQSWDSEFGAYCYAGHDSVLWNNFEADSECMALAKQIDNAMYSYGLSYANVIEMFNEKQAGKWAETIYNHDAQYKYISTYTSQGINYLGNLQGSRSDHRKWWLSTRFALYDSLYTSAAYTAKAISFVADAPANTPFVITAGKTFRFGYGLNNYVQESGVLVEEDTDHTFYLSQAINLGSPVAIYAPYYIKALDLSGYITCIGSNFNIGDAFDDTLGSMMKELIMGVDTSTSQSRNNALTAISRLGRLKYLEVLDISGYTKITTLEDVASLPALTTFKAKATGLTSIAFCPGSPLSTIELPSSLQSLSFNNLPSLQYSGITSENALANVRSISVVNTPGISHDADFLLDWLSNRSSSIDESACSLYMDNVLWENMDPDDLIAIGQFGAAAGSFILRGEAHLTSPTEEQANTLVELFPNGFQPGAAFYITAPDSIYLHVDSTTLLEGDNMTITAAVFSPNRGILEWSYTGSRTGTDLTSSGFNTALLTSAENTSPATTLTIHCIHRPTSGRAIYAEISITIAKRKYPSSITITGTQSIETTGTFDIVYGQSGITGDMYADWSITGDVAEYVSITSFTNTSCVVTKSGFPAVIYVSGTLEVSLYKTLDDSFVVSGTLPISLQNEDIAISAAANQYAMEVMYSNGLSTRSDYMLKSEAEDVFDFIIQPGTSYSTSIFYSNSNFRYYCTSFNEFQYFTALDNVPVYCFNDCRFRSITLPETVEIIKSSSFRGCSYLTSITIPAAVTSIQDTAFFGCTRLAEVVFSEGLTSIGQYAFYNCTALTEIRLPNTVTILNTECFQGCTSVETLVLSNGLTVIPNNCFRGLSRLSSLEIPSRVTTIGDRAFSGCTSLTSLSIPSSVRAMSALSFVGCPSLAEITVDQNNPMYYDAGCNGIFTGKTLILGCNTTTIPNDISTIASYAFYGSGITSITIPSSVARIDSSAFYYSSLASLVLPSTITSELGNQVFARSAIQSLECYASFAYGGQYMGYFEDCTQLVSVIWGATITYQQTGNLIPYESFRGCSNLTSFVFQSNVTILGGYAFAYCVKLVTIELPASVTLIEGSCFQGCTRLEEIVVNATTPPSLGNSVFYNCSALAHIYVPAGSVEAYKAASGWSDYSSIISAKPTQS